MTLHSRIFSNPLKKTPYNFLVLLILLLPVLSCALQKQTVTHSDLSSEEIKELTFSAKQDDDMIRAFAQIELITPKGSYPAKAALTIKRPSYLRMELIPLIGVPDFFLTVSPQIMKIFIPSKGELYSGKPTAHNLKKFLPWSMDIEDLIMIFAGTYPALKENNIDYQVHHEENFLRMEMNAPSGLSQTIWVGEDNNKLLRMVRKDETGAEKYNVQYTYDKNDSGFPEKIKISMDDSALSLSIKFSDIEMEKTTDLSIFDLETPDDVEEISLD